MINKYSWLHIGIIMYTRSWKSIYKEPRSYRQKEVKCGGDKELIELYG